MYQIALSIIEQALIYAPMVCGAYFILALLKEPDLSLQSAFVTGAVCAGFVLTSGTCSLTTVLITSICAGALVSLTRTLIQKVLRVPCLLASIATLGFYHALDLYVLNGAYLSLQTVTNPLIICSFVPGHPELVGIACVTLVSIACATRIGHSQLGACLAALGANPLFCAHYKISSTYIRLMASALAGGLSGISGYLFAQTNGLVELSMGTDIVLSCVCMLMIGRLCAQSAQLVYMRIPLAGTIFFFTMQHLLLRVGFNLRYLTGIQALITIALAMYLARAHPHIHTAHDQLGV